MKARGLGRVYQRPGTQNWWIEFGYRGKKHRESAGSSNRAEAVRLLKRRLAEIGAGKLVGLREERVGFEDLAQMLKDDYAVNGRKSTDRTLRALSHLRGFFGLSRALDMTSDRVDAYIHARQEEGAAPATINLELAALKRAFSLAVRAGRLSRRPYIPTIHLDNARQGFFEAGEFQAVQERLPADLKAVSEFLYLTGWRKGETLPLRWPQVDFASGMIRLEGRSTKNGEGREFPFSALPALEALLRRQREHTDAIEKVTGQVIPWVFHRSGCPIRRFDGSWRSACKAAGLEGKFVHDFRRTAVRNLERAGVPRSVAMKITGHKTESVYRRYAIVAEADLREGVEKLAALHQLLAERHEGKVVPIPAKGTVEAQSGGSEARASS